jgi:hypothetical protein
MQATKVIKDEFVDPMCGMTLDPARAAGTGERDGVRYYFSPTGAPELHALTQGAPSCGFF